MSEQKEDLAPMPGQRPIARLEPRFDDQDWDLLRHLTAWRFTSARYEIRPEHSAAVKEIVHALADMWGDRGLVQSLESEAMIARAATEWLYLLLSDVPVRPLIDAYPDQLL